MAHRVGVLFGGYAGPHNKPWQQAIFDILAAPEYEVDVRYAQGRYDQLGDMANELIGRGAEALLTIDSPAAVAAADATEQQQNPIPIFAAVVGNPARIRVKGGAKFLTAVPNIWGKSDHLNSLDTPERLRMLHELLNIKHSLVGEQHDRPVIALLWNRSNEAKNIEVDAAREIVGTLDPPVVVPENTSVRSPENNFKTVLDRLLQDFGDRLKGLLVVEEPSVVEYADMIDDFLNDHVIPNIWEARRWLGGEYHGLAGYGPERQSNFEWAADATDDWLQNQAVPPDKFSALPSTLFVSQSGAARYFPTESSIPATLQNVPVTQVP